MILDKKNEIWKPVIHNGYDFTGTYEVSNMGRVRNITTKKYLKASINCDGYRQVIFYIGADIKCFKVHVLVVSCFMSSVQRGFVIDHINSDKADNRLTNLQVITKRHNCSREKTIKSNMPCGVGINNGKICSNIRLLNNVKYFLGIYDSLELASKAYQIALSTHEQGKPLSEVFKAVDMYRESINLKPIKRRNK